MSVPWLAGAWLAVAVLAALAARRPSLRRPAALAGPAILVVLSLLAARAGTSPHPLAEAPPALSREGVGLLVAASAAIWVCLLFSESLDGRELLGVAAVGGATTVLLGARSPLLFGVAALVGVTALTLSWVRASPGRGTLAAGRVAGSGAAALIGASIFLPVTAQGDAGAEIAGMAAGLLAVGLIAMVALVPLGGWAAGSLATLRPSQAAIWLLLLAPAVLLCATAIPSGLPASGRLALQHTLLVCGLISSGWAGALAVRAPGRRRGDPGSGPGAPAPGALRYRRIALGDLALVAVGIGTGQPVAVPAALLIILSHLVVGPLLLQDPRAGLELPRRGLWLALSGVPPSPSFWGRFLVLQACAGFGGLIVVACVFAEGLLTLAGVLAITRGAVSGGQAAARHQVAAAWALTLAAAAVSLVPMAAIQLVFGAGG